MIMKTYVLTLSKSFPRTHARAGEPTEFREKFISGAKIHTMRSSYSLWKKRIKEVQEGQAALHYPFGNGVEILIVASKWK